MQRNAVLRQMFDGHDPDATFPHRVHLCVLIRTPSIAN
jgi:hypothetical protein